MKQFLLLSFILLSRFCFAQQDSLVWNDEFNGSGVPDPSKWGYDLGNNGWGNNEIQNYTNLAQNAHQDSGVLIITALKSYAGWSSARLLTHNKFDFKYGRVVFRAKLPVGIGTWPALWMLGSNIYTNGWPACGEIDVMEEVGKDPCAIHSTIHTPSSYGASVNTKMKIISTCSSEYHDYEVKWSSEKMEFSIDSVLYYTYNPSVKNNSTWPFDKTCFIIMNLAMGGNWGSDPQYETGGLKNGIDPSLTSAKMIIDYVRVYQSKPNAIDDPSKKKSDLLEHSFLFPNPTHGKVQLHIPSGISIKGRAFNVVGEVVYRFQTDNEISEIDLSALPKGIYYISLETNERSFVKKIILL